MFVTDVYSGLPLAGQTLVQLGLNRQIRLHSCTSSQNIRANMSKVEFYAVAVNLFFCAQLTAFIIYALAGLFLHLPRQTNDLISLFHFKFSQMII